jgi:hypothetical protein
MSGHLCLQIAIEIGIEIGIGIGIERVRSTTPISGTLWIPISIAISIAIGGQRCPLIAVRFEIASVAPTLGLAA